MASVPNEKVTNYFFRTKNFGRISFD